MIIDKLNMFCSAQAVTVSAPSVDVIDQGGLGDLGVSEGLTLAVVVDEAVAAAGAATVTVQLQCDDNSGFASPKTVIQTDAIPKAELVVGKTIYLPLPVGLNERFLRVYFVVGTGPLTAGKFTAAFAMGKQASTFYPAV